MRASLGLGLLLSLPLLAARPLQVEDLFKVKRVADPQLSVKGDAAWQVGTVDLAGNRVTTRLWFQPAGGEPRELALGEGSQSRPRFSPDGTRLSYQAGGQVWVCDLADGSRRQLTTLPAGASGQVWSPDGRWIAFVSTTVPSGQEAENAAYLQARKARKETGRRITSLMYRHLKDWKDPQQVEHLFIVPGDGSAAPRDLCAGIGYDVPDFAGVAAGDDYAFSPDSRFLAFGAHPDQFKADSTNGELFEVAVAGGPVRQITSNPAMDCTPRYAPDGRHLAWRAQRRPGSEADRWELWVAERASGKVLWTTEGFDQPVGAFAWEGQALVFTAQDGPRQSLYRWEPGKGTPVRLTRERMVEAFALGPQGGPALVLASDLATPPDLFRLDLSKGAFTPASRANEALARDLGLNRGESITVRGGQGAPVQAWVLKPVDFDPAKRVPVAFLIHGGPQGTWNDQWHPRWNAQAWAGRGFLTVLPNPRGSKGWGQAFSDQISGDWNGLAMQDLVAVLDGVLKAHPNADPSRVVCAGGSYGGYAANWLAGHAPDRFAAFVTHAGIFNTESMQLGTEELWFPKWEFQGWPWESPETAARWRRQSPLTLAGRFAKPHLVTHGEIDYRVPVTEAYQLFNVLQLRRIPSELLVFPDEGHTVLKPANSRQWYEAVLGWFERWTR